MIPLRITFRQLAKHPGFTFVAVLTLALGIGANTAVFSVAKTLLWRPLGYDGEDGLMWLRLAKAHAGSSDEALSWRDAEDLRTLASSFEAVAVLGSLNASWEDGTSKRDVPALEATPELGGILRVRPALGRLLTPEDALTGGVLMIAHEVWQSRFSGDPSVLGRTLRIDGKPREIVGVLPAGLQFPVEFAPSPGTGGGPTQGRPLFWLPKSAPQEEDRTSRAARMFPVVARLKPGVGERAVREELAVLGRRLAEAFPESNQGVEFAAVSFRDRILGRSRQAIPLLAGAVAAVLLVCCVNLANLFLARGLVRRRELAVRLAIGAGRGQLVRESLGECLLIAAAGGLAGLGLAAGLLGVLRESVADRVPWIREAGLDGGVLCFGLGLSGLTALVFGLLPAVQRTGIEAGEALRAGTRSTGGPEVRAWQHALLVGQIAAVLVLLSAAGALLESFRRLVGQDLGYRPGPVVTLDLETPGFDTNAEVCRMYRRLRERIAALPGVKAVGTISSAPLTGRWMFSERPDVVGRPLPEGERPSVAATFVAFDYFQAMDIPLLEGRFFGEAELDNDGYGRRVIVNQSAARLLFPDLPAVGGRFTVGSNPDRVLEVIGVVCDTRDVRLEEAPVPRFYWQYAFGGAQVVVRVADPVSAFVPVLRSATEAVDRRVRVIRVVPMAEIVAGTVADRRFLMWMVAGYAGVALGVAALGVFGVVSYQVSQRSGEFGVRLALGGSPAHLHRLVMGRSVGLVLIGLAIGAALSFATRRVLASQLYQMSPGDPLLLSIVGCLVLLVALLASAVPARRASRVDPVVVLRAE